MHARMSLQQQNSFGLGALVNVSEYKDIDKPKDSIFKSANDITERPVGGETLSASVANEKDAK